MEVITTILSAFGMLIAIALGLAALTAVKRGLETPTEGFKLIALCLIAFGVLAGCAETPRAPTNCVEWHDGSDPRHKSTQNTECKSRQRTVEVLRQATGVRP